MSEPVGIACAQVAPVVGDAEGNRARARRAIESAIAAGARLIVLPELCNSGYVFAGAEEARGLAEPLDGPAATLEDVLGACPAYVRLVRADLERQGVSLWTAEYARVWARPAGTEAARTVRVPYSFAGIARCRDRIAVANPGGETQSRIRAGRQWVHRIRDALENDCAWMPQFDARTYSCTVRKAKPDPAIYNACIRDLGVKPPEAVFLDDRPENVDGAMQLGILSLLFESPERAALDLASQYGIHVNRRPP